MKIVPDVVKEVVQRDPIKSLQRHVADMGMSKTVVCKNIKKAGEKSLVRTERPSKHQQQRKPTKKTNKENQRNPGHTTNAIQTFLGANIECWPKSFWSPYRPELNLDDYEFWPHIKSKECAVHNPNMAALRAVVDEQLMSMPDNYIISTSTSLRRLIKAMIEAKGGYSKLKYIFRMA